MSAFATFVDQPRRTRLRAWLYQVHLWLGLIAGLVFGVVGLSGAIVVFRVEMNYLTTPGTSSVQPDVRRLPLDDLIGAVLREYPRDRVFNAAFDTGPDTAWNLRTTTAEGHRVHNFVDQYRGVVVGRDDYTNKFLQWLWSLHADLLGGKTGRLVNGIVAIAGMILSLTGLVVWWPGRRTWRTALQYLRSGRWQRQNYDLHKIVGFYSSLLFGFVTFTGAYFVFPDFYKSATSWATRTAHVGEIDPCAFNGPPASTRLAQRRVRYEDYLRMAEAAMPGAQAVYISFPIDSHKAVGVKLKEPNDWHRVGLSNVYLEPADGRVIHVDRFSTNSSATKFIKLMLPLHFGRFGGGFGLGPIAVYAVMVVYVLIGLAPFALSVTGLLMYWNRSLSKRWKRRFPPIPQSSKSCESYSTR